MLKKKKELSISQVVLFTLSIIYLLESIFIRGFFTNQAILMAVGTFSVIALVVALGRKEWKLAAVDIAVYSVCLSVFGIIAG